MFVPHVHRLSNITSKTDKIQGKHFHNPFPTLSFTTSSPFSVFLSIISYPFSKVCIIPQFCILEKSVTCGVIRSYYFEKFKALDFQEYSSTVYVGSDFPRAEGHSKTWISRHTRAIQPLPVRLCCVVGGSLSVLSLSCGSGNLPTLQWSVKFFPPSAIRNRLGNQLSTSPQCA